MRSNCSCCESRQSIRGVWHVPPGRCPGTCKIWKFQFQPTLLRWPRRLISIWNILLDWSEIAFLPLYDVERVSSGNLPGPDKHALFWHRCMPFRTCTLDTTLKRVRVSLGDFTLGAGQLQSVILITSRRRGLRSTCQITDS